MMVDSTPPADGADEPDIDTPATRHAPLLRHGDGWYVVFDQHADASWASGEPSLWERRVLNVVTVPLDVDALPESVPDVSSSPLRLELRDGEGVRCEATVESVVGLARLENFAAYSHRGGPNEEVTDRALAEAAWTRGSRVVAGRVTIDDPGGTDPTQTAGQKEGGCEGAFWARDARLPEPTVWRARSLDDSTREKLIGKVQSSEKFGQHQKEYESHREIDFEKGSEEANWLHHDKTRVRTRMFLPPDDSSRLAYVAVHHPGNCGAFDATVWALFELEESEWRLRTDPTEPGKPFYPNLVADLDGDGSPELLDAGETLEGVRRDRQIRTLRDGETELLRSTYIPVLGCAC